MTDILGSLEVRQVARTGGTAGLPERVVRAPQLQTMAPLRAARRSHALGGNHERTEECRPQGQRTTDCTPIRAARVSSAPRLNKRSDPVSPRRASECRWLDQRLCPGYQPAGAAARAVESRFAASLSRSSNFWTLPVEFVGNSSMKTTSFGAL